MRFMALLISFGFVLGDQTATHAEPARIMPLGNSITESAGGHASYRYWLWHDLLDGVYDVDFVGSMTGVYGGQPLYPDFDQDHEGHWGWRAEQILAQIGGWAAVHEPEIVLLHLGHNDLWQGQSVSSTIADLASIIDELRSVNATVQVLLAQVIPAIAGIGLDSIPEFNARIPNLAAAMHTTESPVLVVDQFTGFDPYVDTWDGVHPNESGELKMSAQWLESLSLLLPDPCTVTEASRSVLPELVLTTSRPNPFCGDGTRLCCHLREAARIRLTLHDTNGRRVVTLADGWVGAGFHSFNWNGRGATGEVVSGGVFHARLESAGTMRTSKLVRIQ